MNIEQMKIDVLASELNISTDMIKQSDYDQALFETAEGEEYLILTQEEKNQRLRDTIKNDLWAFNANFILDFSDIPLDDAILTAIKEMQEKLCESCQPIMYRLIDGDNRLDEFVEDAVDASGAGNFLNRYDGEEIETSVIYFDQDANEDRRMYFFIYRQD